MKKIALLSVLLALVVSSTVLTSCGDDEPTIKKNEFTKLGKTVDLPYSGIYQDGWGYSIFITDDSSVDLEHRIGTESNPTPANFVTIDVPFGELDKWVKEPKIIDLDGNFYFGACVDGDLVWFDKLPVLVKFKCYIDYTESGTLIVDISAENDYTQKNSMAKMLDKESVRVTFRGKPVIAEDYLFNGIVTQE